MTTKYIIHFKSGSEKEIDEKLYNRFHNRARRGEILELGDGSLMSEQMGSNWDLIEVIKDHFDINEFKPGPMKEAPTFDEVIHPETRGDEVKEVEQPEKGSKEEKGEDEEEKPEIITLKALKKVIEESGLSPKDFAASIEYSPQAVRMAVKEDKISQPFSDKVREVYKL